jgi:chromate transporter
MMHRMLVDEKKWIDEPRFLHALNFCMLLPGPEAQKLATYVGWAAARRARRARGRHPVRAAGRAGDAGLSLLYALGRGIAWIDGALFGIKAAVLVIVVEALLRIGRRALKTGCCSRSRRGVRRHLLSQCAVPADRRGAALIGYWWRARARAMG